jgi:enoyl-CoA hydratase/carnithine racemase
MVDARLGTIASHFKPSQVKVTVKDKIAFVEMNPPQKLVFLAKPLILELNEVFFELEKNPEVSVVILTGKGDSFATGANIMEIQKMDLKGMMFNDYFMREWWNVIPNFRKPLIAAINGMCFGGGLEVAMMADILIASENAKLGQPEINLGILPGSGGTVRLTTAVGKSKAMEMCLTGDAISA